MPWPVPFALLPWAVVGGVATAPCELPTAVSLGPCSGVLVDAEWVLTAGHCGDLTRVMFGPDDSTGAARRIKLGECIDHPTLDAALCRLATPQLDLPIVPPAMGCEVDVLTEGSTALIVGYGLDDSETSGTKHVATAAVGMRTGSRIRLGGDGVDGCLGDSGGPAFVQLGDGTWRLAAIASTGDPYCEDGGNYVVLAALTDWIEQTAQRDVTPCHDADGVWNPDARCRWLPTSTGAGDWVTGCVVESAPGPGTTCGVPFVPPVDPAPPTVDLIAPSEGEAFSPDRDLGSALVEVHATADSAWGIDRIELRVDGEIAGYIRDLTERTTIIVAPGVHDLSAAALDYGDATAETPPIRIDVDALDEGGCRTAGRPMPPIAALWILLALVRRQGQRTCWKSRNRLWQASHGEAGAASP